MQKADSLAVLRAINCYDDPLLVEAQKFGVAFLTEEFNEDLDTSALSNMINESEKHLGNDACWQHDSFRAVVDLYYNEEYSYMLSDLVITAIKRSVVYERAFC